MSEAAKSLTLFLAGDVMLGRGIDQVLPHPSHPALHEPYLTDARGYVALAERANGPLPRKAGFSYVWGEALDELERMAPDFRIINLETSITESEDYCQGKDIHYRMNPKNIGCLRAAGIDFCSLANNHILDWGCAGHLETLETLKKAGVKSSGAGRNIEEASAPAVLEAKDKRRVILFSFGAGSSGIPSNWAASRDKPGVNRLEALSERAVQAIAEKVRGVNQTGIVLVSLHWGSNWGYGISREEREFAHGLIDYAGVDLIHGHSSHHVKGLEVYKGKLVLYGCGDFLNDYEGIGGYEVFRGDLGLMYFASLDPVTEKLNSLSMIPTQIKRFRVNRASRGDALWLRETLNRESREFGAYVESGDNNVLRLGWSQ
ncbi:MAG: CapA family protein [Candidatus Tectomicrobia bacterium]|uniref:CapA family protein n=1 Tax=Tectimicrobiota bacterium TaxID=2528274 RepID=A0A933GP78_UNCTE|nr:CapA family protein [Candidatus Tectomicrobia bacterium]